MTLKHIILPLFLLQTIYTGVLMLLLPPENLRIQSENLINVLNWSSNNDSPTVKFFVQYRYFSDRWQNVTSCPPTEATHCNFTSSVRPGLNVTLRVGAEDGDQILWRESEPFRASDQTLLGPPCVTLFPKPHVLIVRMDDPVAGLREEFGEDLKYRVYYGEENGPLMEHGDYSSQLTLESVKEGVKYCVKVEYVLYGQLRAGSRHRVECALIPESEYTRMIKNVLVVVTVVIVVGGVILACLLTFAKCHDKVKEVLRPPLDLPDHFREFFKREDFTQLGQSSTYSTSSESFQPDLLVIEEEEDAAPGQTAALNDSLYPPRTHILPDPDRVSLSSSESETESQASHVTEEENGYSGACEAL
ncbi:interferon gamma receptor 2 isoform X2 [Megalops cyprinoides]|uniref:interferon gamma receptor 2 isoform X2 n=1 Tax=Megalops cyprinoides TaxID=118141 RepID=UPI0018648513|nr:interferon gamma receptor 2 isoform X2 [Megalops cyprinoides]